MREFAEFSKIDLHQHFGGDDFDRKLDENFDKKLTFHWNESIDILKDAKRSYFDLIAMTNQNVFDAAKYLLLRKLSRKFDIELIPGIEINYQNPSDSNKFLHTVILFDSNENLIEIQNKVNNCIISNRKNYFKEDDFLDLILKRKAILIPHGVKQSRSERSLSSNPEMVSLFYKLEDAFPVFIEDNKRFHKESLKIAINDYLSNKQLDWFESTPSISSSDRQKPSEITSPTYIWGNNTFTDLYYCALMNDGEINPRVKRKEDIIRKIGYIKKIKIKKSNKTFINNVTLNCSHGLNTIIGSSGSGKTLLISYIKRKLKGEELTNKTIAKKDYNDISDVNDLLLYDENDRLINLGDIEVFEGENLYNKIIEAYESNRDTLLKHFNVKIKTDGFNELIKKFESKINDYIDKLKQLDKVKKQSTDYIKAIESTVQFLDQNPTRSYIFTYLVNLDFESNENSLNTQLKSAQDDLTKLMTISLDFISIAKKYNYEQIDSISEHKVNIENLIKNKIKLIKNRLVDLKINKHKKYYLMNKIQEINKTFSELSKENNLKKQELIDFNSKLNSSMRQYYSLKRFNNVPTLNGSEIKKSINIEPNDDASITIRELKLKIEKDNLSHFFPNHIGANASKNKIGLNKFTYQKYDLTNQIDVRNLIMPFVDFEYTGSVNFIMTQNDVIDYDILLKDSNGQMQPIENITAGSLSKIYIQKMFDDSLKGKNSKTIIVYDQPDTNMEKEFILLELVKKIKTLKDKYQIFITTHEPLLVVNADANNIILARNDKTISNNIDISYSNIDITSSRDISDVYMKISTLIDGNHKAVKFRNKVYGGMINENRN